MKHFLSLVLFLLLTFTSCVSQSPKAELAAIKKFQSQLNKEYKNPKDTPLRGNNFSKFKEHPFFPVDLKYRVVAKFIKTENAIPFELPTSSGKTKTYREFGKSTFVIDGQELSLTLYQNLALTKKKKYRDYLFLPFRDLTNEIFNQSYHPYCAYNAFDYNCPIVPAENFLPIRIEAGVQYEDVYHD